MIDREILERQRNINLCFYPAITIIGVGGVGSWVALFLGLSGQVETLTLIDDDKVEVSNLNRTPYKLEHIGRFKVDALAELILERRPFSVVIPVVRQINTKESLVGQEIIIDCRDTVDDISEVSPLIGGYDSNNITLSVRYKHKLVFDSGIERRGYATGSWIMPPVVIASIIVSYLLCNVRLEEGNYTMSINEMLKNIFRRSHG